jgi:DNA-binding GntR family transcriptional regulator
MDEAQMQQRLADAIFEHRLPPGTKLAEVELCGIFNVSRGAVRKVLARLAGEKLVDLIPNRGAFVARPSVDETRDVYEVRRIIEAGVVRLLTGRAVHGWIEPVRRQVAEEREANRAGESAKYIRLAGKFHADLAAATGNQVLGEHLKRVVAQTSLMVALYDVPGTNACSMHEHLEILDAIAAGDATRAEQLMDEHLRGCERQLRLDGEHQRVDLAAALLGAGGPRDDPSHQASALSTDATALLR